MFNLLKNPTIDFLGMRKAAFILSLALVALGFFGLLQIGLGKAKMAIDFAGGSSLSVKLEKEVPLTKLRSVLSKEFKNPVIQQVNEGAEYLIRIGKQGTLSKDKKSAVTVTDKVLKVLSTALEADGNRITGSTAEEVGPSVSRNLRVRSLQALAIALTLILFYIMFRFGQRFSVGAVVATLHDILAVIGILVISGVDFSLLIVVALLTIAGYSLNDTVVVFDRIRENYKTGRSKTYKETVNESLNQVLSRTLNTSITTLLVLVSLYIYGGEVFHGFSLALILGVVIGTYSSLFVASPLVYEWNLRHPPR